MKVAFVIGTFPTLSETFIINQITTLLNAGVEVDIYAFSKGRSDLVHCDVNKYNLLERTTYACDCPKGLSGRFLKGLKLFAKNIVTKPSATLKALNFFRYGQEALSLRLLYIAGNLQKVTKQYDVIHCHFGPKGIRGLYLKEASFITGRLVVVFHGGDISKVVPGKVKNPYKSLFESKAVLMPISDHWKNRLIELGADTDNIIVHHMGIDVKNFSYIPRKLKIGESVKLISVARLTEKKGLNYAIEAINCLGSDINHLEYNIIGDGSLKKQLQEQISRLGLNERVHLLGGMEHKKVQQYLRDSHILLAPSVTSGTMDQEGIPVSIMEAMAMGLPVVSTYHSGIPELVQDGQSGFLVAERDVEALAERIRWLYNHTEAWQEIGKKGSTYVYENFNIQKLNENLCRIYRSLC